jgi:hypothetical protein
MRLNRVVLLVTAALVALALTANAASATVVDAAGDPYDGPLSGHTTATFGGITCQGTFTGSVTNDGTGNLPSPGGMTFQNCTPPATVTANGLPYSFTVDATTFVFTSAVGFTISGAGAFNCTASETANDVTGAIDWSGNTITFNETLSMSGTGCGTTATWQAVYDVTPDLDWM